MMHHIKDFNFMPDWNFVDEDFLNKRKRKKKNNKSVCVEISFHENEASDRKALIRARKKFMNISGALPKYIEDTKILDKKRQILFTSVQTEYIIEITANFRSIKAYCENLNKNS